MLLVAGAPQSHATGVDQAPQHHHTVVIKSFQFQPAELTVDSGDMVEWENQDIVPHTVTSEDGSFRSGKIAPGKKWSFVTKNVGRFSYSCTPHPNMHGVLVVR
jgi:plastocyanin